MTLTPGYLAHSSPLLLFPRGLGLTGPNSIQSLEGDGVVWNSMLWINDTALDMNCI